MVRRRAAALVAASEPLVLDCGEGVRLLCEYSPAGTIPPRSVVVLLHGWEGSSESLYVLSLAQELFAHGHAIARLNLRDHGPTHHLNRELFHSNRLPEVLGAVAALRQRFPSSRLGLCGFSLGGNFALRVASHPKAAALDLAQVFAVCPVLDPQHTLHAMEEGLAIYENYFIRQWTSSLGKKQAAWPGQYDFSGLRRFRTLRLMTAALVRDHTEYATLETYLEGYAVTGARLASLCCPATLLAALDDPIIPAPDLGRLAPTPRLRLVVTRHGGHCGFVDRFGRPSYADRLAVAVFAPEVAA
jgi:uncharacterized protein